MEGSSRRWSTCDRRTTANSDSFLLMSFATYPNEMVGLADQIWRQLESYHDTTYFVQECREAFKEVGIKGGWARYFAGRAAPMGEASAGAVVAAFYNFAPRMVSNSIPAAWEVATPAQFIEARLVGIDRAMRRLIAPWIDTKEIAETADALTQAALSADPAGKVLFGANAGLEVPSSPHLKLFHAATLIREHRGDLHNSILMNNDISGVQAHVLMVALGHGSREDVISMRGWNEAEWSLAKESLIERSLIAPDATATVLGRELRISIELQTELASAKALSPLGTKRAEAVLGVLVPIVNELRKSGELPEFATLREEFGGQ